MKYVQIMNIENLFHSPKENGNLENREKYRETSY